jgi:hypothetical protein
MGENPLQRLLAILGPEMARRKTSAHKITNIAVFYTAQGRDLMILIGANLLLWSLEGVGPCSGFTRI